MTSALAVGGQGLEERQAEGVVWVLWGCWLVVWGLSCYQVVGGGAEDSCDKGDVLHRRGVLTVLPRRYCDAGDTQQCGEFILCQSVVNTCLSDSVSCHHGSEHLEH